MKKHVVVVMIGLALAGCGGVTERVENAANRSYTSGAMGQSYAQVTAESTSALASLSGRKSAFGPLIGSTQLQNGMTIYRHIAPSSEATSGASFGGLIGTSASQTNFRLSYFLVGPDGLVKDWATGSVPGNASDCVTFIAGIVQKCREVQRLQASLQLYDARVRTRSGQPIAQWGPPVQQADLPGRG